MEAGCVSTLANIATQKEGDNCNAPRGVKVQLGRVVPGVASMVLWGSNDSHEGL